MGMDERVMYGILCISVFMCVFVYVYGSGWCVLVVHASCMPACVHAFIRVFVLVGVCVCNSALPTYKPTHV